MSNLKEIVDLVVKLQELAKAEWGDKYLDCDCGHDTEECRCDCFMCVDGWKLTEYREIHTWEKELLPIITAREPLKLIERKM